MYKSMCRVSKCLTCIQKTQKKGVYITTYKKRNTGIIKRYSITNIKYRDIGIGSIYTKYYTYTHTPHYTLLQIAFFFDTYYRLLYNQWLSNDKYNKEV